MVNFPRRRTAEPEPVAAVPEPVDSRQAAYEGFRALGLTPARALSELVRLGVMDAAEAGRLTRPWDVWQMAVAEVLPGHQQIEYISLATRERLVGARVLASWLVLSAEELAWLEQLRDGSVTTPDLSADDAAAVLEIARQSRAEQDAAGPVEYAIMSGRTSYPCRPGWWWGSSSPLRYFVEGGE